MYKIYEDDYSTQHCPDSRSQWGVRPWLPLPPPQWGSLHPLRGTRRQGLGVHSGSKCAINTWHISTVGIYWQTQTWKQQYWKADRCLWRLDGVPESCPKDCKGQSRGCRYDLRTALYLVWIWFQSSDFCVSIWKITHKYRISYLREGWGEALLLSILRYQEEAGP